MTPRRKQSPRRSGRRRAAREPLSRARIVAAARRLIDERGLERLSMRALGEALGVEAMSIYHHVRDKAELLEGVHAAIMDAVPMPPAEGPWDERARIFARGFRAVLLQHPNALPIFATWRGGGEASMRSVEVGLSVMRESGLPLEQCAYASSCLGMFVVAQVTAQVGAVGGEPVGAEAVMEKFAAAPLETMPNLAELMALGPPDFDAQFEFGLEAMLLGFRALAERGR